jgi:hypothetical protein
VLAEGEYKPGMMQGFTDNYVKVALPGEPEQANSMLLVEIESTGPDCARAKHIMVEE